MLYLRNILLLVSCFLSVPSYGAIFNVNFQGDANDANPGDGVCAAVGTGLCTLRAAISEANALPGADTINLPAGTYFLNGPANNNNTSGSLYIASDIILIGHNMADTIIDANQVDRAIGIWTNLPVSLADVTIKNGFVGVNTIGGGIYLNSNADVTLTRVKIADNSAGTGGGLASASPINQLIIESSIIENNSGIVEASRPYSYGGGLNLSTGTVTINNSTIRNNSASFGGGIYYIGANLTMTNSTMSENLSFLPMNVNNGYGGGAIHVGSGSSATLVAINSTISGNRANGSGAGILIDNGTVSLYNTTVTGNVADYDNDGQGYGGGVIASGTGNGSRMLYVSNSIIAGNISNSGTSPDCSDFNITFNSLGHNLIGNNRNCYVPVNSTDLIGTDITPIDPMLGVLADNGGPTMTHMPAVGSPVIDAADVTGCKDNFGGNITIDQRGAARPVNGGSGNVVCDIGAVEIVPPISPDSILATSGNLLLVLATDGSVRQEIPIPPSLADGGARDLIMTDTGKIAIFNGTFTPVLSVYDPQTGSWDTQIANNWNTENNVSYGGIALRFDNILATDMLTGENGLISFSFTQPPMPPVNYLWGNKYIDVTTGQDGYVYALKDIYGNVNVIEPMSMLDIRDLNLGPDIRGVTADRKGNIYAIRWGGEIAKFDKTGKLLTTAYVPGNLTDIDINEQSIILVADSNYNVHILNSNLTIINEFPIPYPSPSVGAFVAFAKDTGPFVTQDIVPAGKIYDAIGQTGDYFAENVDVQNDHMIIGNAGGNNYTGSAFILEKVNNTWQKKQTLVDPLATPGNSRFGQSVAIFGDFAAASNPMRTSSGQPDDAVVLIFQRTSNGDWQQVQEIVYPGPSPYANFGYRVALSGNKLAISAPQEANGISSGVIYTYRLDINNQWVLDHRVFPVTADTVYDFGSSFSLTDSLLVTTAYDSYLNTTKVFSFHYTNDPIAPFWTEDPEIQIPPELYPQPTTYLSAKAVVDGNRLVVGIENMGLAVYRRDDLPSPWQIETVLTEQVPVPYGMYGSVVAINGKRISTYAVDVGGNPILYVYQRDSQGWTLSHRLTLPELNNIAPYLTDLEISGDALVTGFPQATGAQDYTGAAYYFNLNPGAPLFARDTDSDGIPDYWEQQYGLDPFNPGDVAQDNDNDMLTNIDEYKNGADPTNPDSDNDMLPDGEEVLFLNTDPALADTDGDGLPDGWEVQNGTNPLLDDTQVDLDNDGLTNQQEFDHNTIPTMPDTDTDGLLDGTEVIKGSNPLVSDTDGDGVFDGYDNCLLVANSTQTDADSDGYGNRCDADLNNDGIVNLVDFVGFRNAYLTTDPVADFNSDGIVNLVDFVFLRNYYLKPPGPSGLVL